RTSSRASHSRYRTADELRAEQPTESAVVPLSQGAILDDCPLVFWADQTGEVAEDNSRRRASPMTSRSLRTGPGITSRNRRDVVARSPDLVTRPTEVGYI